MRVYFDPNMDPQYFYSLIKPLTLIYDQLYIWSPVRERLSDSGFTPDDFLRACQPAKDGTPVIIPAARDQWFDRRSRQGHPVAACRNYNEVFESSVLEACVRQETILSSEDFQIGYRVVDELWDLAKKEEDLHQKLQALSEDASLLSSQRNRVERVAKMQKRSVEWAVANAYAQDILATNRLGGITPVVKPEQARGYLLFVPSVPASELAEMAGVLALGAREERKERLPGLPPNVSPEGVLQFLEDAYGASELSWSEVERLRGDSRFRAIRTWISRAGEQARQPLTVRALSDIAASRVATQKGNAKMLVNMGIAALAINTAMPLVESSAFALCLQSLVKNSRFEAPLCRWVVRCLGGSRDRLLLDTHFWKKSKG